MPPIVPKFQGDNFYANKKIAEGFKVLAEHKNCKLPQVALAWVAAQGIIPLAGTTKPARLADNWAAREVELSAEDLDYMRKIVDSLKPQGDRYNEEAAKNTGN